MWLRVIREDVESSVEFCLLLAEDCEPGCIERAVVMIVFVILTSLACRIPNVRQIPSMVEFMR